MASNGGDARAADTAPRLPLPSRRSSHRPASRGSFHIRSTAMADYFVQFSCIFDVGSAENVARAIDIRGELAAETYREEGGYLGFEMEADHEKAPGHSGSTATNTASRNTSSPSCCAARRRSICPASGGFAGHSHVQTASGWVRRRRAAARPRQTPIHRVGGLRRLARRTAGRPAGR